jgi:hypothetical protein
MPLTPCPRRRPAVAGRKTANGAHPSFAVITKPEKPNMPPKSKSKSPAAAAEGAAADGAAAVDPAEALRECSQIL